MVFHAPLQGCISRLILYVAEAKAPSAPSGAEDKAKWAERAKTVVIHRTPEKAEWDDALRDSGLENWQDSFIQFVRTMRGGPRS